MESLNLTSWNSRNDNKFQTAQIIMFFLLFHQQIDILMTNQYLMKKNI